VLHRGKLLTVRAMNLPASKAESPTALRRLLWKPQLSDAAAFRPRPFGYAIRSIANSSPRDPASSAAARPPKRTTFALLNRVRLTARSATSTRSQSAASIIANCTDMAMKPRGGQE